MMRTDSEKTELESLREENRHLRDLLAEHAPSQDGFALTGRQVTRPTRSLAPTQDALEQQLHLFDTVLSTIVDFAYVFDREGRFTYINRALLDLWQLSLTEAVGKNFFDLNYPTTLATQLQQQIQTVYETGQNLRDETPYTSPSGETGYYEYIFVPVFNREGEVEAVVGSTRDISQRYQQLLEKEALRESEERVRLATEAAGLGIWVWEPAADRVLWENDRMYEIYGLSPSEEPLTTAEFLAEIVHPEDAQAFARAIAAPIETGAPLYFAGRFRRKDGALRWIEFRGRLQPDANGKPLRVVGTAADITDRQRAEEQERRAMEDARAAAEANAKFRTFFEQGSYFAGVMTLDGTLIEANRLCLDACGFRREEVIGKKFWDCGWWNRSEELMEMIRRGTQAAASGSLFHQESTYFLADGTERFVDLILAPVTDEDGRVLFIAPSGTDITERKQAEHALEEHAKEIEALNVRLRRAMTETHHRVKNNLQVISAMIEMQIMEHQDENTVPLLEYQQLKAHIHTLSIVHDLLSANLKEEEDAQRVSVKAVLDRLLPMLQQTAWNKAVRYSMDDAKLTAKHCIALALILNELITNALKHGNSEAEALFRIEGAEATLEVSDDGPGFPPDFHPLAAANMGLELVESLVRADLKGQSRYGNRPEGGGRVIITFLLPPEAENLPQGT